MPKRVELLREWLTNALGMEAVKIEKASDDASFRRYFRVTAAGESARIAMDAPPDKEDCRPFVALLEQFGALGLHVPALFAQDLDQGFLLLEDLGSTHYLDVLAGDTADRLYGDALAALAVIQSIGPRQGLPEYDAEMLHREMMLFSDWLVNHHLGLDLDEAEQAMLKASFESLSASALEQPQVCVHRDFHSRNLLVCSSPTPGIIDFQDAVLGPVTYDLVSLLKDCYIDWPEARVKDWVMGYFQLAVQSGILKSGDEGLFLRWFDLMGVQRHLKASGIFARLNHRDGKPGYLGDIPRTLNYIVEVARHYPEMAGLGAFIKQRVLPAL
ncbi:MAG: phosphotransferase [Sedimenticola sp.]|nr:phosphotransferase [Sedimenticola sp.]